MVLARLILSVFLLTQFSVAMAAPVHGDAPSSSTHAEMMDMPMDEHCGGAEQQHETCEDNCAACAACSPGALVSSATGVAPLSMTYPLLQTGAAPPGIRVALLRPPARS